MLNDQATVRKRQRHKNSLGKINENNLEKNK